jgi:hypothetical protein
MKIQTTICLCFLALNILYVSAFLDNLADKTVKARKEIDDKCLGLLSAKNITQVERCEFFKCFEDRYPCGTRYWIMNWGYKYCRRYADQTFVNKFTPEGKKLLEHVNKCLPSHFEKMYKSKRPLRCKKLSQDAFNAQGKCYQSVQSLFCKAFPANKDLFIQVLDQSDFINMDSITMIKKTADKCNPKIDFSSLLTASSSSAQ